MDSIKIIAITCFDVLMFALLWKIGIIPMILAVDMTYISLIIMVLYFLINFIIMRDNMFHYVELVRNSYTSLGFLGTMIGFVYMMYGVFSGVNVDNIQPSDMKEMLIKMTEGIGVAIWTSITGLVAMLLTEIKLTILNRNDY